MKKFNLLPILFAFSSCLPLFGTPDIRSLYSRLPSHHFLQLLTFGHLYSQTSQGYQAYLEAYQLLLHTSPRSGFLKELNQIAPDLIAITLPEPVPILNLSHSCLHFIDQAGSHLGNRKFKGFGLHNLQEVASLNAEDIDIGRALLLAEFEEDPNKIKKIHCYEAVLDWMALSILSTLSTCCSDLEKISAINHFLFRQLHYRFPPESLYKKHIKDYSLLGKVIEAKQGVCLGTTFLYISLAQRLELPLKIITPPGHIFLKYQKGYENCNIETTAGGIDVEDRHYLGLELETLPERSLKEGIGLSYINTAAMYLHQEEYIKALQLYKKAALFLPEDPSLLYLMGFCLYLNEQETEGKQVLNQALQFKHPTVKQMRLIAEDLLEGKVRLDSLKLIYKNTEVQRPNLEAQAHQLQNSLEYSPYFRAGWMHLAMLWKQLQREDLAWECLKKCDLLFDQEPVIHYLLAEIALNRQDYLSAWQHLSAAEKVCQNFKMYPEALRDLRNQISSVLSYPF